VKCETLEVLNVVHGEFVVKYRVRAKTGGFRWALVAEYGSAQIELKPDFLADFMRICGVERLPIITRQDLKNSDNFDGRW